MQQYRSVGQTEFGGEVYRDGRINLTVASLPHYTKHRTSSTPSTKIFSVAYHLCEWIKETNDRCLKSSFSPFPLILHRNKLFYHSVANFCFLLSKSIRIVPAPRTPLEAISTSFSILYVSSVSVRARHSRREGASFSIEGVRKRQREDCPPLPKAIRVTKPQSPPIVVHKGAPGEYRTIHLKMPNEPQLLHLLMRSLSFSCSVTLCASTCISTGALLRSLTPSLVLFTRKRTE